MNEKINDIDGSEIAPDRELVQKIKSITDLNQLYWLHGLINGIIIGKQNGNGSQTSMQPVKEIGSAVNVLTDTIKVLYATQSGNSRKLAQMFENEAKILDLNVVVSDMADYDPNQLRKEKFLVIFCSTQGEGDPPLSGEDFFNFIHSSRIKSLSQLKYAVLSLGDRSYVNFCKVGRDIGKKLSDLGGSPVLPTAECDIDFQEMAGGWISKLLAEFQKLLQTGEKNPSLISVASPLQKNSQSDKFTRMNPGLVKVTNSINLNGRGSDKKTVHLEVLDESGQLNYQPGDSLGVFFENSDLQVKSLLKKLKIPEKEKVSSLGSEESTIGEFLTQKAEINLLTPDVLERVYQMKPNLTLRQIIDDPSELSKYIYGRDLLDLFTDFPVSLNASNLSGLTGKMQPRLYSIASSPKYNEGEVHLTVANLEYESNNRKKYGACSAYITNQVEPGQSIKTYISENENFRLPDSDADIIMIGPGTGIAPFRSFMQERELTAARGKNWLFFGDQHFTTDFLYQTEWLSWRKKKLLTRINVAFSRDQAEKQYVQQQMIKHSSVLFQWISGGAHVYICGDKKRMAKDVNETLLSIFKTEGNMKDEHSREYLKELKKQKRYHEDVY